MSTTGATLPRHADDQSRHDRLIWWLVFALMSGGGLLIAGFARRRFTEPFLGLSLAVLLVMVISWTYRPRATFYATLFLTVVSDIVTVRWFPFAKNLSSRESISFVSDSLTISPLDISLVVGFIVTAARQYARTGRLLPPSPLTRPILVFTAFVVFGFGRGLFLSGRGDIRVAVLEARPLLYLLLAFGIAINVCTSQRHLRYAMWWAIAGVTTQVLLSIDYLNRLDPAKREALESLGEHGSTLGHNLIIITAFGLLTLGVRAFVPRVFLMIALFPTIYIVFVSERRAGIAALAIAVGVSLIVLFWRHRRRFWAVTPLLLIVSLGYLGVFWTSASTAGFPAQAIKSIVAPSSAAQTDQNSDLYRTIEAFDVHFTYRLQPVLGVGFGKPFYRPVPLPDIGVFELNAFVPHHSVLWIWLKMGFFGFAAMFYVFAKMIVLGSRRVRELDDGIDVIVAQSAVLFTMMYLVFTYVDVSWDARNMVLLGLMAAICAHPLPEREPNPPPAESDDTPQPTSVERTTFATTSARTSA